MKFSFNLGWLFGKRNKSDNTTHEKNVPMQKATTNNSDKIERYRALEEEMFEKMRNPEVEKNVKIALEAVDCNLIDFERKANNIAGCILSEKSFKKQSLRNTFIEGAKVGRQELSLSNSFKLPKAADYYFENFYSDEKQLELFNQTEEIKEKYNKLMNEV